MPTRDHRRRRENAHCATYLGNGSTEPLSYPSRTALHPSYVIRIVSDLKTTMEKAGVKGTPQVWFTTSAAE